MFKRATVKEKLFYEQKLYPLQDEVLTMIQSEKIYLSGGTALSRFYYNHRYSDDLDFFFDGYNFSADEFSVTVRDILNRISEKFTVEVSLTSEFFIKTFIDDGTTKLKVEFIFENYKCVGNRTKKGGFILDSKENLVVNKLTTIYDRRTVKDYLDLYFLLKEFNFKDVAFWAEYKIVPMVYEDVLTAFSDLTLDGTALLIDKIDELEFNEFVKNLIRKMVDYAQNR